MRADETTPAPPTPAQTTAATLAWIEGGRQGPRPKAPRSTGGKFARHVWPEDAWQKCLAAAERQAAEMRQGK